MSFTKTTSDDFDIITNGVDNRIQIIRHKETGFYNITKMAELINELKKEDNVPGIPVASNKNTNTARKPAVSEKRARDWFQTNKTKESINACLKETGLTYVHYELKLGTPKEFYGTYLHKLLYNRFMIWLDGHML